jgi:UDP-N-acetylglucosamine 4,6-dehydratase
MKKRLLITGGTGTVGNAFIKTFRDQYTFFVYSRNETLQHQTRMLFPEVDCILGSITDKETLYNACDRIRPDVIVHAAALKHVDVAEKDPIQTMAINIVGSLNVINAAINFNVPVTVAVSTDKACNHQNIYGMSKFLMEKCFLQANTDLNRFSACRFANVAHSNGSVIPLWLKMTEKGTPLKVTDPRMNRMMFSQRDAALLIGKSIQITEEQGGGFVLSKLMKNVNIFRLASVISTSVQCVGPRPGEKIDEDLISDAELPFTRLVEDGYVKIEKEHNPDVSARLVGPVNTLTVEQMTDSELRQLVFNHEGN